ncbi:MAG: anthranilate phosphoribosyltransferase [Flavobacteriales bacterium]|nr:anthranilate phosphoribosyltransferase [Flavobacteriales bacterium]
MKQLLNKIIAQESFSFEESKDLIYSIENETVNQETLAGILIGFQIKGLDVQEVSGFRKALLELCTPIEIESENAIDLCGTGGDGKNTFNISTTSSLILAAMGRKVIKHGNYGVSSVSGSSNVLEAIGFSFQKESGELQRSLDDKNICFLHAPLFHPTLKKAAGARGNLGVRTLFNCLGPLVNPAQPKYQLTGTYSLELAKTYQHILKNERNDYRIVFGMDGYDEITLTDSTRVLGKYNDQIVNSSSFDSRVLEPIDINGGSTVDEAAKILMNILKGQGTYAQSTSVSANVAMGLQLYSPNENLLDLFNESQRFIASGQAAKHFNF